MSQSMSNDTACGEAGERPDTVTAGLPAALDRRRGGAEPAVKGRRPVWFPEADGFVETTVYDRGRLAVRDRFDGPAVIEEEGSTLVVPPAASVAVASTGNVVVTLAP